jgi:hypothetical protein
MKDETVEQILERCINLINEEYKDWDPKDSNSNDYLAYGPSMAIVLAELESLRKYFYAEAKFDRDMAEAYNEGWPDFVDGDII